MKFRTKLLGSKFVAKTLTSDWFAQSFVTMFANFLSTEVDLGEFPLRVPLSACIEHLKAGYNPFGLASRFRNLRLLGECLRLFHHLRDPRNTNVMLRQCPKGYLDRLLTCLHTRDFPEMNRICHEAMISAGYEGTADLWELITMVRAAQTSLRCLALYKVSPVELVRKAAHGDRQALLDLIKVDKLFFVDNCTQMELHKASLASDKLFLDQVSRAIRYRRRFGRRDACRVYLWALFAIEIELPKVDRLRETLDPEGSIFPGDYAFSKFYELCGKGLRAPQT